MEEEQTIPFLAAQELISWRTRPDSSYYAIPQDEWNYMPTISASDIHVDNILYEDRHSATENDALYTGGAYYIDLD